jgi:hypothetical protein
MVVSLSDLTPPNLAFSVTMILMFVSRRPSLHLQMLHVSKPFKENLSFQFLNNVLNLRSEDTFDFLFASNIRATRCYLELQSNIRTAVASSIPVVRRSMNARECEVQKTSQMIALTKLRGVS